MKPKKKEILQKKICQMVCQNVVLSEEKYVDHWMLKPHRITRAI